MPQITTLGTAPPLQCADLFTLSLELRNQRLRIKHVDGIRPHKTASWVRDDYNLLKAADTEATVSTHVYNDAKLYQPRV